MSDGAMNQLFFNLLSAAIWDKPPDASLFVGLNTEMWRGIVEIARRQGVSALIADKALLLPKENLAPRELNLQFILMIQQTEAQNRKMIRVLSEFSEDYQAANFPFCLLKGLGNGMNYPSPKLRIPGDLDLFLYRKGDYEKSKKWITAKGIEIEDIHHIHYNFIKEDIIIENHWRITSFDNKKYDKLFKKWEHELIEKDNFTTIQIDNLIVRQLPVEMNAFFIFQHMFRHFVHFGVGFRQFCDWILFLSKYKNEINPASFTSIAKSYALLYPMQVFARGAVKYLDTPENIFPFKMINDNKHVDWVITDILDSGNFGFYRAGKLRPKNNILGLWFSYKNTIQRAQRFGEISPEHSRILPAKRLINRLKNAFK